MSDEEKNLIKNYPEAAAIVEMASAVWRGDLKACKVGFSASEKLRAELKNLLNKDIQTVFITDSDVRHIKKRHGQREELRGQVNITPEDFALLPVVFNEFDTIEYDRIDKLGNRSFLFSKRVNGTIFSASIERGKEQIEIVTLWKKKRSGT
jgi:hypothetical protein